MLSAGITTLLLGTLTYCQMFLLMASFGFLGMDKWIHLAFTLYYESPHFSSLHYSIDPSDQVRETCWKQAKNERTTRPVMLCRMHRMYIFCVQQSSPSSVTPCCPNFLFYTRRLRALRVQNRFQSITERLQHLHLSSLVSLAFLYLYSSVSKRDVTQNFSRGS